MKYFLNLKQFSGIHFTEAPLSRRIDRQLTAIISLSPVGLVFVILKLIIIHHNS